MDIRHRKRVFDDAGKMCDIRRLLRCVVIADGVDHLLRGINSGRHSHAALLRDLPQVDREQTRRISVSATDQEALLVAWLSELNYLFLTSRTVFAQFELQEIGETSLVAEVRGEPLDLNKHEIYTEVKAVTYHGLYIRKTAHGLEAQIIFDL